MPVIAVVAGIAAASAGAAGAAALIAGTVTLSTVAAGLAVVGGISTALGAITGNKKLQKFGMITGLAGAAIGGLASLSSAGSQSATALSAGDAGMGLSATAAGEGLQVADTGMLGIGNKATEVAGGSFGRDLGEGLSALDTGASTMVGPAPAAVAPAGAPAASYALRAPAGATAPAISDFAAGTGSVMADAAGGLKIGANKLIDTGASAFAGFGQFVNGNPGIAKVGSGMLSGLGQGYMAQQQQKDAERMSAEQRTRVNASIQGQRQRY